MESRLGGKGLEPGSGDIGVPSPSRNQCQRSPSGIASLEEGEAPQTAAGYQPIMTPGPATVCGCAHLFHLFHLFQRGMRLAICGVAAAFGGLTGVPNSHRGMLPHITFGFSIAQRMRDG